MVWLAVYWLTSRIAPGANFISFSICLVSAETPDAPAREDQVDPEMHGHWNELPCVMCSTR
jgi:hypothetical protein